MSESTIEISPNVELFKPWSLSKAGQAHNCPAAFTYKYVSKTTGLRYEDVAHPASRLGKIKHSILENVVKGTNPKIAIAAAITGESLSHDEKDEITAFLPVVLSFMKRVTAYTQKHKLPKQYVEARLGMSSSLEPLKFFDRTGRLFLRGVIDYYSISSDLKVAMVLDHKTGKPKALEEYELLFTAYNLLMFSKYPTLEKVIAGIHHTADGEILLQSNPVLKSDIPKQLILLNLRRYYNSR